MQLTIYYRQLIIGDGDSFSPVDSISPMQAVGGSGLTSYLKDGHKHYDYWNTGIAQISPKSKKKSD